MDLPIKDWKVIHSRPSRNGEDKGSKKLLLTVDRSSVELLKKKSDVVNFGLEELRIRVLNEDRKKEAKTAGSAN